MAGEVSAVALTVLPLTPNIWVDLLPAEGSMVPRIQIRIPSTVACKLARVARKSAESRKDTVGVHSLCTSWIKLGFRVYCKTYQLLYQLLALRRCGLQSVWILCRDRSDALGRGFDARSVFGLSRYCGTDSTDTGAAQCARLCTCHHGPYP
jgi:hypothetical protein